MTWEGVGVACKIDGRLDADLYVQILEDELQQPLEYFNKSPKDILFQKDNDPKHTSRKAKNWFEDHDDEVMYSEPPKGITELWERVEREWERIEAATCQELIQSMPRRVQEVLKSKGGYTHFLLISNTLNISNKTVAMSTLH
ncbi:hypothetical protein PAXRUDRAFT_834765 [Paxillus rubicundulus Ve08.2h10]|uniref:Tc1-like transposase DDE domain-containing protein n=1 Tax=Paxillus rubicundulus Ve08.2h10 TaxID=930991 RepID=A0A0D0C4H0_9AGAM|nr:hypothetical protein PAXRUDRAFT_834765 [Paxillus rubicundulus Ve08.2h10]